MGKADHGLKFLFPFSEIKQGSRIILYGAGDVGYDFYRQLVTSGYCELMLWVDRQYEWFRQMRLPVEAPEKLLEVRYDYIVVAVQLERTFVTIREELLQKGVRGECILWSDNYEIRGNIAAKYDRARILEEAKEAVLAKPIDFVSADRLDLVVRWLYAGDIIKGRDAGRSGELYRKLMMVQNDGSEPSDSLISDYFTEYSVKSGWKAFDSSFRKLIGSMQVSGFAREFFIPLDRRGRMINGSHRLAAALALNMEVYVRRYPFDGLILIFDQNWLIGNGFTQEEVAYIVNVYTAMVREA